MKLYVWHDVLTDYTSGVMFAMAESATEAREAVEPGWAHEEARRLNGGPYPGAVHEELRQEPIVYETATGFAVWGGG